MEMSRRAMLRWSGTAGMMAAGAVTLSSSDINDSTSVGRSVVTGASAAAIRTALAVPSTTEVGSTTTDFVAIFEAALL